MKFPQSKKFLEWYLKEREKQPTSIIILAVQDQCALNPLTEEEISRFQLIIMGALIVKNKGLCSDIEEYYHEVNDVYDTVRKEYGIR